MINNYYSLQTVRNGIILEKLHGEHLNKDGLVVFIDDSVKVYLRTLHENIIEYFQAILHGHIRS